MFRKRPGGFTLVELLVVIAILAILAGILFPVFARARSSARKAVCISNFKQMMSAVLIYTQDYDETLPVAGGELLDCSRPCPFLCNLLTVYTRNEQIWDCPEDYIGQSRREVSICDDVTPEPDRVYARRNAALRCDFALNWQYLGPAGQDCMGLPGSRGFSVTLAAVQRPAETIYAADSVWWRLPDGSPDGGGTGFIEPPCRYLPDGTDTFTVTPCAVRGGWGGWTPSQELSWQVYGGVWPWHSRVATVSWVDGHAKARTPYSLTAGCDVKDFYGGFIYDLDKYLWDLN